MRALLFDPERQEILLIKALVPDTGVELWFTPGGGKEPGESDLTVLAREVFEETGLRELPPARLVWTRSEKFVFMGDHYHQDERYYLVQLPRYEVGERALEAHEEETFLATEWWPLDRILESQEQFVPGELGVLLVELLQQLAAGELADEPRHVGR